MDVSQITALIGAAASLLCTVVVGALTFFMKKTLTSLEEADKRNAEDIKALDKNLNEGRPPPDLCDAGGLHSGHEQGRGQARSDPLRRENQRKGGVTSWQSLTS